MDTMECVWVAMPLRRCMKLSAVRSAVRIEPAGPSTSITTSPTASSEPSSFKRVILRFSSTRWNTLSPTSAPQRMPAFFATILALPCAVVGMHAKVLWSPSPMIQGQWTGDFESNNAWYKAEALKNKGQDLDLLILPELFHTPYFPFEENADFFHWAIEKGHPLVFEWREIAKELHCVIVFPFFEKRSQGIYHNSAYVFERDGSIAGLYRKSHIPDDPAFYEKYYFIPGDTGFEPIQTSAGNLGILICWDQ